MLSSREPVEVFCVQGVEQQIERPNGGHLWASMAIAVDAAALPNNFRIFGAGWNESTKGRVLFDDQAAADVMAAYSKHAVDIAIDLEHLSLDTESRAFDPDARGWCRLEVRAGELWAVDVKWTPDGQVRLSERRQRYVSPAFWTDRETKRVTEITNIAITAMPATHGAQALVAASKRGALPREWKMSEGLTIEKLPALAEALGMAGDASLADVMAALRSIVMAADGEPQPTETTPEEAPVEEAVDPAAPPKDPEEEEKAGEAMAATARLLRLSGRSTLAASLDEVATWKASHLELEAGRAKLRAEQDKLEAGERRTLVAELVKLGVELPATAWADDKAAKPSRRLAAEPLSELRERVATWRTARGGKAPAGPAAPKGEAIQLSARELKLCSDKKIDPAVYAEQRAAIAARSSRLSAQEG